MLAEIREDFFAIYNKIQKTLVTYSPCLQTIISNKILETFVKYFCAFASSLLCIYLLRQNFYNISTNTCKNIQRFRLLHISKVFLHQEQDTLIRCFQYKVLNNVLFPNENLFLFKKSNSPFCSFYKEEDETVFHFYFYCPNVTNLWNQLKFYLAEDLTLPSQTLQAAVFGFFEKDNTENAILCNLLFLIVLIFTFIVLRKKDF